MNENGNRYPIIEALILSSPEPLEPGKIAAVVENVKPTEIDDIVRQLNDKYRETDASFRIRKIAGGYQMYITENYAGFVTDLYTRRKNQRLTRAALETLSIIAYRQPVTRSDIELIRGVSSDSAIKTLLERKLITLSGRAQTIGRPLLYSTTDEFLKFFNLDSLNDLPRMEEIEEILSAADPDAQQKLVFENGDADDSEQVQEIPISIDSTTGGEEIPANKDTDTIPHASPAAQTSENTDMEKVPSPAASEQSTETVEAEEEEEILKS